jgi:6-phosphogluconolactonase (cycloisomerase 2 family)
MTNLLGNNEIVAFHRASDGTLTFMQRIATGGGGSGVQLDPSDSLGSQGGLMLNQSHTFLFAVNTESLAEDPRDDADIGDCQTGTISSFRVAADGTLTLVGRVPSGGLFPASLAIRNGLLYVLNAGGPGLNPLCGIEPNITGFTIGQDGQLTALANSTQPIDPGTSPGSFLNCDPGGGPFPTDEFRCGLNPPAFPRSPGQIGFTPNGQTLVVTVKGTNSIYVFPLDQGGRAGTPTITQAQGPNQPTYFGFVFDRAGNLIVSEPFGATPVIPAAPFSAVSSFAIDNNGNLQAISASVPNGRGTACWVVLDPAQQYAYIANNATSDISSYRIGNDGSLTLLEAVAAAAELPNDMAVAGRNGNSFFYVLNSGAGTVGAFRINTDGSLTELGAVGGLPIDAGAQGLAAY